MTRISVLILTKNEQQDLPGCLASVAWSDDVHVYDSVSTDRTVEIAEQFGPTVTKRPFDTWPTPQTWSLATIPLRPAACPGTRADDADLVVVRLDTLTTAGPRLGRKELTHVA